MSKIIYRYKTSGWTYVSLSLGLLLGSLAVIMMFMGVTEAAMINGFASGMNLILAVWSDREDL